MMLEYHDTIWGVPLHDDRTLFEFLILDGAQAGLSWELILKRREGYARALDNYDIEKIANYGDKDTKRLLADPGIIRNRLKVASVITNAQAFIKLVEEEGSFDEYLWSFAGGKPIQHRLRSLKKMPTSSPESDAMSKALKKRGFKFVGTTICYAYMQSIGMFNDHLISCHRYDIVCKMGGGTK